MQTVNDYVVVVGYNTQVIQSWKDELKNIPKELERIEPLIEETKTNLSNIDSKLFPIEQKIARLNGEIGKVLKGSVIEQIGLGSNLMQFKNIIFGDPEVNALFEEKKAYTIRRNELQKEKNEQRILLEKYNDDLVNLKQRKQILNEKLIPEAVDFLKFLSTKPEHLVLRVAYLTKTYLQNFDANHFNQDIHVRLCLFNLNERLNKITVNTDDDIKNWQIRYAQLCGFLWELLYQYEYKNNHPDLEFFKLLKAILQETHIPENSDLPDDTKTGLKCSLQFERLKTLYPKLYSITKNELEKYEIENYKNSLKALRKETKLGDSPLHHQVSELADAVDNEITKPRKPNNPKPDYKLYTRVLNLTHDLLINNSESTLNEFANLADHVNGQPSRPKKVLGLMFGIIGTIVTVGCIVATIATFGALLPATVPIVIATTIAAQCASVAGTAVAAGLTGLSWGFFGNGQRHNISAKMKRIEKTKKSTPEPDPELSMKFA